MTGLINPRIIKLDSDVVIKWLPAYKRTSTFNRILTWFFAFLKSLFLIKIKYRNSSLFLVTNPPLTIFIPLFCKNQYTLLIYDVYPDTLVGHKSIKANSSIIKIWSKINKYVFNKANNIYTISEGMKSRLAKYIDIDRIRVVPVWTDNEFLKPIIKKENVFIQEQQLEGKFVIMYSGNMGKSHPLEVIVKLANKIKDVDVFFLIVGQGDKYLRIKRMINESCLGNIRLLPWQLTEKIPFTFSAADLAIVTLGNKASELSIPSKIFNFLSVGCPILGVCEEYSDLSKFIIDNGIGESFRSNNMAGMLDYIKRILDDRELLDSYKERALLCSKKFNSTNAKLFVDV